MYPVTTCCWLLAHTGKLNWASSSAPMSFSQKWTQHKQLCPRERAAPRDTLPREWRHLTFMKAPGTWLIVCGFGGAGLLPGLVSGQGGACVPGCSHGPELAHSAVQGAVSALSTNHCFQSLSSPGQSSLSISCPAATSESPWSQPSCTPGLQSQARGLKCIWEACLLFGLKQVTRPTLRSS